MSTASDDLYPESVNLGNTMNPQTVIDFWFREIEPRQWFTKDSEFDRLIERRFQGVHEAALKCELFPWRDTSQGRLAEIIVLDQFSRNIYRDTPLAFASDPLALVLAQEAVRIQAQRDLPPQQRPFLYMPFMHSESPLIHEQAVVLFGEPGLEKNLEFELRHKDIIDRFGRYPHRNTVLGRVSTSDELAFLKTPGSSF
jgi:uncharacterized protein (DUF924 family)